MMCGHLDVSIGRTKNTAMREMVIIGHDECRKLINDGYYVHVTHGIHGALDETRHITFTLNKRSDRKAYTYRTVTEDGQCTADSGSNFRSGYTNMTDIVSGTTWAYYEDTEFEIYVGEIEGVTHQASNSVRFGHLTANADDRNLTDSTLGYVFWEPIKWDDCKEGMQVVYTGPATTQTPTNESESASAMRRHGGDTLDFLGDGKLLFVKNSGSGVYGGLMISKDPITTCRGKKMHTTNVKGLSVVLDPKEMEKWQEMEPWRPDSYTAKKDLHTKMTDMYLSLGMVVANTALDTSQALCKHDRERLRTQLAVMAEGGDAAAMLQRQVFGDGTNIYYAGDVLYVYKCKTLQVLRTNKTVDNFNCTDEMPVIFEDKETYMNTRNLHIVNYPTMKPCTTAFPPVWEVEEVYYTMEKTGLEAMKKDYPNLLHPQDYRSSIVPLIPTYPALGSIYSGDQLAEVSRAIFAEGTIPARTANEALRAIDELRRSQGGRDKMSFGYSDSWMHLALADVFAPMLPWLGQWFYLAGGCLLMLMLVGALFGIVARAYAIFQIKGFHTRRYTAVISGSLYAMAMMPVYATRAITTQVTQIGMTNAEKRLDNQKIAAAARDAAPNTEMFAPVGVGVGEEQEQLLPATSSNQRQQVQQQRPQDPQQQRGEKATLAQVHANWGDETTPQQPWPKSNGNPFPGPVWGTERAPIPPKD